MATRTQLRFQRLINRRGRTLRILETGEGVERRYTGEEEGFIDVKAVFFTGASRNMPGAGQLERLRGIADEQRGLHREVLLKVGAASLSFVPTERTRIVDGERTFAVADVDYQHAGEDVVTYTLVLRAL
jgi:hypothetical protein